MATEVHRQILVVATLLVLFIFANAKLDEEKVRQLTKECGLRKLLERLNGTKMDAPENTTFNFNQYYLNFRNMTINLQYNVTTEEATNLDEDENKVGYVHKLDFISMIVDFGFLHSWGGNVWENKTTTANFSADVIELNVTFEKNYGEITYKPSVQFNITFSNLSGDIFPNNPSFTVFKNGYFSKVTKALEKLCQEKLVELVQKHYKDNSDTCSFPQHEYEPTENKSNLDIGKMIHLAQTKPSNRKCVLQIVQLVSFWPDLLKDMQSWDIKKLLTSLNTMIQLYEPLVHLCSSFTTDKQLSTEEYNKMKGCVDATKKRLSQVKEHVEKFKTKKDVLSIHPLIQDFGKLYRDCDPWSVQ